MQKKYYEITNIYEVAFLLTQDFRYDRVEKTDGFIKFIFEDKNTCIKLLNKLWAGTCTVNAKRMIDNISNLKRLIRSEKNG